jgi:hypothetical protein
MFSVIVIPWDPIMMQKRKELIAISLETLLVTNANLCLVIVFSQRAIK